MPTLAAHHAPEPILGQLSGPNGAGGPNGSDEAHGSSAAEAFPGLAGLTRLAAEHAVRAEADRRLTPEVAAAIRAAGFHRYFVPARWGGAQGGFTDFLSGVATLAQGDPSAAWCASVAATMGRMAAFLPPAGQRLIWQDGPDLSVVGSLMPGGNATAVRGGWELSGRWAFLSGIHHCDHALLCAPVPLDGGGKEVRFLLVPRSAYTVERTWFTVGMRATGSDTLVLDPVFVPAEHSFARDDLVSGTPRSAEGRCYQVPLKSVSGRSFAAPVLGAVQGALAGWTASTAAKQAASVVQSNRLSSGTEASAKLALARSDGELDAARLLLERSARDADAGRADPATAVRAHRDYVLAVELLLESVGRLFRTAGTRSQSEADPFQRFWRDANAASGHAVLQWEPAARAFAALRLEVCRESR